MRRIRCAEIWGGVHNCDEDILTSGITASLYSAAADGGRGGDIYYLSVCSSDLLTRIAIADVVGQVRRWRSPASGCTMPSRRG